MLRRVGMPAHLLERLETLLLGPLFRKRSNYRRVCHHFGNGKLAASNSFQNFQC